MISEIFTVLLLGLLAPTMVQGQSVIYNGATCQFTGGSYSFSYQRVFKCSLTDYTTGSVDFTALEMGVKSGFWGPDEIKGFVSSGTTCDRAETNNAPAYLDAFTGTTNNGQYLTAAKTSYIGKLTKRPYSIATNKPICVILTCHNSATQCTVDTNRCRPHLHAKACTYIYCTRQKRMP
jgi:hypothetical protein